MMKTILLAAVVAFVVGGCATSDDYRYSRYDRGERLYVSEEHPREVIVVERDGRTYVRERDYRYDDYRGSAYNQNNMEPRVRGKHADALGWNTENYYLQRGY
jgi:hypothetical protein